MTIQRALPLSVAIPTYRRERVLLDTLDYLLALDPPASEILVVDQSEVHEPNTERRLNELHARGTIRWIRLDRPSIPCAMNCALLEAKEEIILFVDDDIRPDAELVRAHYLAHQRHADVLIAGRVIQPWQEGMDFSHVQEFQFAGLRAGWIQEFIGCNFSLRRDTALARGGFDQNFVRVAYRFEAEFAYRFLASGRSIYFEPDACVHHLKAGGGGTRTYGDHLTTINPGHAVGAYYYCLRTWKKPRKHSIKEFFTRPLRAVATRHHLRHPWWIPGTACAEISGMCWALALYLRGPRYVVPLKRDGAHA